jgi:hypothetical protein
MSPKARGERHAPHNAAGRVFFALDVAGKDRDRDHMAVYRRGRRLHAARGPDRFDAPLPRLDPYAYGLWPRLIATR